MMGPFLPSNILLTPWPSANTMLSSRANTSCLSWQNEPVCIKMRVNGKQKEPTKVPSFLYFGLKHKICMFWCFLPAHQLQKAPRHLHIRWWDASGTFPSEAMTISFLHPVISTWLYFDEVNDSQFPLTLPYQKLNFSSSSRGLDFFRYLVLKNYFS